MTSYYCLHFSYVSPFRIQTLKTKTFKNSFIYRENQKVTAHTQGMAQKRPEKTLSVHLRLVLDTVTAYDNTIKAKAKNPAEGRGSDCQIYIIIRFKCPALGVKKKSQGIQTKTLLT